MNRIEKEALDRFPESMNLCATAQREGFVMGANWWQEQLLNKAKVWFNEHANIPYEVQTNEDGEPLADSYIDYCKKRLEAGNEMFEAFKAFVES